MTITSYLIVVTFYMLSGCYIYILMRRILSNFIKSRANIINAVSIGVSSVLAFGGVGLSTFAFFYLSN
jgi:hypothetical protein